MRDWFEPSRIQDTARNFLIGGLLVNGLLIGPAFWCALTWLAATAAETGNLKTQVFIGALWTLPATLLFAIPGSWIFYGRKAYRTAIAVIFAPLISLLLIVFALLLPLPTQ
jgi:hypothetical protein